MKALKIKKKLYLKPRICPECKRICLIAENYASERCEGCHKHHRHQIKRIKARAKFGNRHGKYTSSYRAKQKKCVALGYCQLCGATENLTAHHIGGDLSHKRLTCLCEECHSAYERWNLKRKVKKCYRVGMNLIKSVSS